jgi:uncharacterized ferredoxin-like protein
MIKFTDKTIRRAEALRQLAIDPLKDTTAVAVIQYATYPKEECVNALWLILCQQECTSNVAPKLENIGIATNESAQAFMDRLEPELRRWQSVVLGINARAKFEICTQQAGWIESGGVGALRSVRSRE